MKKYLSLLSIIYLATFIKLDSYPDLIDSFEIINKNKIVVKANKEFGQKFIKEDFFAEYNKSIDLTKLDKSIVLIPFILNIVPVVWLSQKSYSIDVMDKDLYYSLKKIKEVFRLFYSHHVWSGELVPKKLVTNIIQLTNKSNQPSLALLFSGGLDSVNTSISHVDSKQLLITAWGADVKVEEEGKWKKVAEQCRKFAQTYGHDHMFVRSNFREFIETPYLYNKFPRWWVRASFGLSFVGLAAPILALRNLPTLFLSAGHTIEHSEPNGSHSAIDNNISFTGITVCHAQADKERIQKIMNIKSICEEKGILLPCLRVCSYGSEGKNCLKCEKCIRTCTNIIVAGQKPREYGFGIDIKNTVKRVKRLLKRKRYLHADQIRHWKCNALHLDRLPTYGDYEKLPRQGIEVLRNFLCSINFEKYRNPRVRTYSTQERALFAKLWKESMKDDSEVGLVI